MQITVTFVDSELVISVVVPPDMTVHDFGCYVAQEAGLPPDKTHLRLIARDHILPNNNTLAQCGLADQDMVLAQVVNGPGPGYPQQQQQGVNPASAQNQPQHQNQNQNHDQGHSFNGHQDGGSNGNYSPQPSLHHQSQQPHLNGNDKYNVGGVDQKPQAQQNQEYPSQQYHQHQQQGQYDQRKPAQPLSPSSDQSYGGHSDGGDATPQQQGAQDDKQVEGARQAIIYNPDLFAELSRQVPLLADAIYDPERFNQVYRSLQEQNSNSGGLTADEQRAIDENYRMAMDEMPEAFASVTMLYANIEVNGVPIKAFVDSGAQTTIMSPECVERCRLSHLIDKRHRGLAYGVGQAQILGRIHMAPIKIGRSFFPCAMTVIEGTNMDMLLGLDMLKHHQATIDLKHNVLLMGNEQLPFLDESEIPKRFLPDMNGEDGVMCGGVNSSGSGGGQGGGARYMLKPTDNGSKDSKDGKNSDGKSSNHKRPSSSENTNAFNSSDSKKAMSIISRSVSRSLSRSRGKRSGQSSSRGPSGSNETSTEAKPSVKEGSPAPNESPTQGTLPTPSSSKDGDENLTPAQDQQDEVKRQASMAKDVHSQQYPSDSIKKLMDLGFSRARVLNALDKSSGNQDFAASILFDDE